MTGRGAYSARLPLLTPEASALVVNGTNVGAILTHAHAQSELRAALITLGVNTQPQSIDARITRLCTGLGLAQSGVWLTDRVDGTAPPQIPPATTPDGPPPVVTPPVVPQILTQSLRGSQQRMRRRCLGGSSRNPRSRLSPHPRVSLP